MFNRMHYMKSFLKIILLLLCFIWIQTASATHNRAGEITYKHVSGFTYEFTITTYTKVSGISGDADRTRLGISWGDGTFDSLDRASEIFLADDIKQNKYIGRHTYSGPFKYVVGVTDPNRIENIINISNSVAALFYLEDTVIVSNPNIIGYNNSPQLLNPPIEYGNVGQVFTHNPNAFDPDGDSLSYYIMSPLEANNIPVNGYTPPNLISPGPDNQISINQQTGELTWDAPQVAGIYNIVIVIREYRGGVFIGTVMRDLQIIVDATSNRPPNLNIPLQLCKVVGDTIQFTAVASDPNLPDRVTLSANGGPFTVSNSPATFTPGSPANPVSGVFRWATNCSHLLKNDYQVVFNAVDNFQGPPLTNSQTLTIKLLAPPPKNIISSLDIPTKSVLLRWDSIYTCAGNSKFIEFSVWRKKGCGTALDTCNTDLSALGYERVGSTTQYSFRDINLQSGNQYSYRVVAEFGDRTNSGIILNRFSGLASSETCIIIPADIPLLYNVDVRSTDAVSGQIYVEWSRPFPEKLDTILNPGPYVFRLYRATGLNGTDFTLVKTVTAATFSAITDTSFLDNGLNTAANAYNYKLDFFASGTDSIGSSEAASSVFLNIAPAFEALSLTWTADVPWINTNYVIYRQLTGSSTFDSIATVSTNFYTDINLKNDTLYCYKIKAIGSYPLSGLKTPLINFSQEACSRPSDTTKPCTPLLTVSNFCIDSRLDTSEFINYLSWSFPQSAGCITSDIVYTNIFYAATPRDSFVRIDSVLGNTFNNYTHVLDKRSLLGCYAVQAVRKNGNQSPLSASVCVENCPVYELPNAFTPNGDGQNDLYTPIFPYRFVEKIELKVYNRWGNLVFETTDPDINWNGNDSKSNKPLYTGVYYYICEVYYQSLEGLQKLSKPLSGYIHLFREK